MGVRLAGKSAALAEVNQGILEVARDSRFEEQAWDFFCECGEEECHEYVLLAVDAYVRLHDSGGGGARGRPYEQRACRGGPVGG
jgi:hypothetical protein